MERYGSECLKVGSQASSDNILLTNPVDLNAYEHLKISFDVGADDAPKVNWGKASQILVRLTNEKGTDINIDFAEFAYNLIRVYSDNKEIKAADFSINSSSEFEFEIIKKKSEEQYSFDITYRIGKNTYTANFPTVETGRVCIGFKSLYGNSLYIDNVLQTTSQSYEQPDKAAILKYLNKTNPSHPRIMLNDNRLDDIRSNINNDSRVNKWYRNIHNKADAALSTNVSKYELRDGERLLYVSRDVYANTVYPAFVYLIEGKEEYKERVWRELSAAADFEDWHPAHFLDTAEMTYAFAICYDWLYDYWSEEERQILRDAIKNLGLDAAKEAYDGTASYNKNVFGAYHNRIGWKNDPSNWGLVCNGGIACGAAAIISESDTVYCAKILEQSIKSIETPLSLYAADGSWSEGIGYRNYATKYLCYMISSIDNTLGTDLSCLGLEGIKNSAAYLIGHTGPCGIFNYGDCSEGSVGASTLFYFAEKLNTPDINAAALSVMDRFNQNGDIDSIIFYNPALGQSEGSFDSNMRFDNVGVAVGASSVSDPQANYIAIKGGPIGVTHGDLDAGSFIIDALGVRWSSDLGADAYTLSGYFETPRRYDYYRKRAEGHSTIVINPNGNPDQKYGTTAYITDFKSGSGGMCTVMDMTEQYSDNANNVTRAAALFDNNSKFIVRDTIKLKAEGDVYWFMQTARGIKLSADKKTLTLSSGNKHLMMILQSDCDTARFAYTSATPLSVSPNPSGQSANAGYKRISVISKGVKELNMQVVFIPYMDSDIPDVSKLPKLDSAKSVSDWDFESKEEDISVMIENSTGDSKRLAEGKNSLRVIDYKYNSDIVMAKYSGSGILKSTARFEGSDEAEGVFDITGDDYIKLFFWKCGTMEPQRNTMTIMKVGIH